MLDYSIIEFSAEHQSAFKALNLEWLEQFNLLEPRDLEALDDPKGYILDGGGVIYLAVHGGQVIGSAAVIVGDHGEYELAKMAVAKPHRGKGVSKALIERCLKFCRENAVTRLVLYSNHQLVPALKLYEKYGFRHVDIGDSPFATADVKMEIDLNSSR